MYILGLIPARGGSKGIPKKNIYCLCGKPMIGYVIEKAMQSKYIKRLIVSTDDKEIAEVAREFGAEAPFIRPVALAKDTSPTLPVVKHAVDWLKKNENYSPKIVVILQANSPLMKTRDIDRVIGKQIKTKADVVYTVTPVDYPVQWLQKLKKDRPSFILPEEKNKNFVRRQDFREKTYRATGAVYSVNLKYLLRNYHNKPRLCFPLEGQDSRVIIVDPISSLDIDNWLDLYLAESILEKVNSGILSKASFKRRQNK